MHSIHPSALVSPDCELEDGVDIGPGCVVSGPVRLGRGVRLIGNVYLSGPLTIGEGTLVYPFACIGFPGQDFKFKPGDKTAGVTVGRNCIIREHATIHAATNLEKPTRVGDGVMMMCGSHVGHDATVENRAIMVNGSAMGGHSFLGEAATISANTGVHQYGRVGRQAFVSANVAVTRDVPPYCMVAVRGRLAGLNIVGLRRSGMPREHVTRLREAYRAVFRVFRTRQDTLALLEERVASCPPIADWITFIRETKRSITPGFARHGMPADEDQSDEVPVA